MEQNLRLGREQTNSFHENTKRRRGSFHLFHEKILFCCCWMAHPYSPDCGTFGFLNSLLLWFPFDKWSHKLKRWAPWNQNRIQTTIQNRIQLNSQTGTTTKKFKCFWIPFLLIGFIPFWDCRGWILCNCFPIQTMDFFCCFLGRTFVFVCLFLAKNKNL